MISDLNLSGRPRLPVIRQSEAAECGLAALAMVASYYGYKTDLATLRRKFSVSMQGMTLRSIMDIATKIDLSPRSLKLPLEGIYQLRLPAIIHWDLNHFVVLKSISKKKILIHDPAHGEKAYDLETFSKHFTGVALELTPTQSFEKRTEKTTLKLSDLWGRMFGLKRNLVQVLVLSIILQAFVLASPFYLQIAVDEVLTSFDTNLLTALALGFAGFTVINMIAQTLRGYVLLYFGSMLTFQMVGNLFSHMMRLPVGFFEKRHIGDIVSRFSSLTPVKNMLTEGLIAGVIDGLMAITTLIFMFIYSPSLALIAITAWGGYLTLRVATYGPFRARQEGVIAAQAKEQTTFMESVRGITSLKLFGGEKDRERYWKNHYADSINENARFRRLAIWFEASETSIFGLEFIILVYLAVTFVLAGEGFTVGMIFAFMSYKRNFTDKASALVERLIEFKMLGLHLERIADIAHTEQEQAQFEGEMLTEHNAISGALVCENIRYRYGNDGADILKGINLRVNAGESVAIVGASGCGKTTLLKLMTGLFSSTEGAVFVDGKPLPEYGLSLYRRQIGVVMQQDDLFAGSIADNISFFDENAEIAQVMNAANKAMMHDEIMAMPMNYESLVGDMGAALSGGQKQRIMLARALYRDPKILFMDEGTAHLDVETEWFVNQSISKLGITRLIIAHRPETIRMADRVIEIKSGVATEVDKESISLLSNKINEETKDQKLEEFFSLETVSTGEKGTGSSSGAEPFEGT